MHSLNTIEKSINISAKCDNNLTKTSRETGFKVIFKVLV